MGQTDGLTPDRFIELTTKSGQYLNSIESSCLVILCGYRYMAYELKV